ncbi:unnamed protein product [Cylindrotheca closterium]|uniref:HMG box domain-containing protein n=1 Tax=Cylindrotheca closterium TaxID=2856 RepID=A0AAD2CRW1_9STRA|nr:unnamed protein product [Cylindrotheca closterium]
MTDSNGQFLSSNVNPTSTLLEKPMVAPILHASTTDHMVASQNRGLQTTMKHDVAPKRFKSSFIFFSMEKHKEIKEQLAKDGKATKTTNITKIVSDAWRNLSSEDRAKYNAMASEDKERYDTEKAAYSAPPGASKKKTRTPGMPRRPSSAFLAFANCRRAQVKAENMDKSNGAISKILSIMWKEADEEIKSKYKSDEAALWKKYKTAMEEWRKKEGSIKQEKGATLPLASINRNPGAASAYAALLHGGIDPYGLSLGLSGSLLGSSLGYSTDFLSPSPNLAMLSALSRQPLATFPFERSHSLLSTQALYGLQEPLYTSSAHQLSLSRMAAFLAAERRAASQGSDEGNTKTVPNPPESDS